MGVLKRMLCRLGWGVDRIVCVLMVLEALLYLLAAVLAFFGAIAALAPASAVLAQFAFITPSVDFLPVPSTPRGGVLHIDYLAICFALLVLEYPVARLGDRLRDASRA